MAFVSPALSQRTGVQALGVHRLLMRSVSSACNAFLWVFIFEYFTLFSNVGHALTQTFLLYALTQTTTILLVPFALGRLRGGMRRGVVYGTLVLTAALVYVGTLLGGSFPHGMAMIGILLGAYRALYRVPYTIESAAAGRVGGTRLPVEILIALIPVAIGLLLDLNAAPSEMFFSLALFAALSLLTIPLIPNAYERFSWGYRETFGHLAAPENNQLLVVSVWRGIEGGALLLLWPLALFFVTRSYLMTGAIFSMTLLGVLLTRASKRRVFVEQHADGGTYLDEYTALKEIGLALGRLLLGFGAVLVVALLQ